MPWKLITVGYCSLRLSPVYVKLFRTLCCKNTYKTCFLFSLKLFSFVLGTKFLLELDNKPQRCLKDERCGHSTVGRMLAQNAQGFGFDP